MGSFNQSATALFWTFFDDSTHTLTYYCWCAQHLVGLFHSNFCNPSSLIVLSKPRGATEEHLNISLYSVNSAVVGRECSCKHNSSSQKSCRTLVKRNTCWYQKQTAQLKIQLHVLGLGLLEKHTSYFQSHTVFTSSSNFSHAFLHKATVFIESALYCHAAVC